MHIILYGTEMWTTSPVGGVVKAHCLKAAPVVDLTANHLRCYYYYYCDTSLTLVKPSVTDFTQV